MTLSRDEALRVARLIIRRTTPAIPTDKRYLATEVEIAALLLRELGTEPSQPNSNPVEIYDCGFGCTGDKYQVLSSDPKCSEHGR